MAKVLVVDDNEANRELVATLLRYRGHVPIEAADGAEALAIVQRERPGLVICDLVMPVMDGFEFVRQLRADSAIAATEVIFYTANYRGDEARELARNCGVRRVIEKPADPAAILDAIEEGLAGGRVEHTEVSGDFDREHLRLMTNTLSEKARMLERAYARLTALNAMNLRLASERDPRKLMDQVCDSACGLLGGRFAILRVRGKGEDNGIHTAMSGLSPSLAATLPPPPLDLPMFSPALLERRAVRVFTADCDPVQLGLAPDYPRAQALLASPIASLNKVYGWIAVYGRPGCDSFSDEDERLLSIYAAQAGRIYENGSLFLQVQRDASRLRESDERLRLAEKIARLAHVITRPDGSFESFSETLPELAGVESNRMPTTAREWLRLVHPEDRERFRSTVIKAAAESAHQEIEYRLRRGEGWIDIRQTVDPITAPAESKPRWFGTMLDVTDLRQAERRIRRLNRMHAVLSGINTLIVRTRDGDQLLHDACRILGEQGGFASAWIGRVDAAARSIEPAARYQGRNGSPSTGSISLDSDHIASTALRLRECIPGEQGVAALPIMASGEAVAVLVVEAPEVTGFDEEETGLLTELAGDIGFALQYLAKEARLDYLGHHDPLTGLLNSASFREHLAQSIAQAGPAALTVFLVDLDRFTQLNDTLGRAAGDTLLTLIARRLQEALPASSLLSSFSADTFAISADGLGNPTECAAFLDRTIFGALDRSFSVAGRELHVSAHAGVAVYPGDGADAETVFKNAEVALQQAKPMTARSLFYDREMNARVAERLMLEVQLRSALANDELVLHYQPIVALGTGRIVGVEALLRWNHPRTGLMLPGQFLSVAEELHLTTEIGEWVLHCACRDAFDWQERHGLPVVVSVNVSSAQFFEDAFVDRVRRALADTGLDPDLLEIELTENIVMEDAVRFIEKLVTLKRVGVRLALDDFGTGYSSLSYMKRFPLDTLKIDQSFIRDLTTNPDDASIVRAVLSVGHSLGLDIVAEGVETEAQLAWLHRHRCEKVQGYVFSRPVPASEIPGLVSARHAVPTDDHEFKDKTLLIVDDEANVISSIVRLLRRYDCRILTASSAAHAFELLARNEVQVILSDHRMPVMTGAEFLGRVKALYPDTVRILFSGYVEVEALTEAVNRGAVYRFLLKPWDDDVMRETIRDAFEHYWLTHGRSGSPSA